MRQRHVLALAVLALSGCTASGTATAVNPAAAIGVTPASIARFQAIANGVLSVASAEAQIAGASPDLVAKVQADATTIQTAINTLVPGMAALAAAPTLDTVKAGVDNLIALSAALPLPASARQVVLAVQVMLPIAEASILAAPVSPVRPAAVAALPPSQASAVLLTAQR